MSTTPKQKYSRELIDESLELETNMLIVYSTAGAVPSLRQY